MPFVTDIYIYTYTYMFGLQTSHLSEAGDARSRRCFEQVAQNISHLTEIFPSSYSSNRAEEQEPSLLCESENLSDAAVLQGLNN